MFKKFICMKKLLLLLIFFASTLTVSAQQKKVDSLTAIVKSLPDNEKRLKALRQLVAATADSSFITIRYAKQRLALAKKLNKLRFELSFLGVLEVAYSQIYNYPKQLEFCFEGLNLSQKLKNDTTSSYFLNSIMSSYIDGNEPRKAISYGLTGLHIAERIKYKPMIGGILNNTSRQYIKLNILDSALYYMQKSYRVETDSRSANIAYPIEGLGEIEEMMQHNALALSYYHQAIPAFQKINDYIDVAYTYIRIAKILKKTGPQDSVLYYARLGYNIGQKVHELTDISEGAEILSGLYEGKNDKESLSYYKIAATAKDSLSNTDRVKQFQVLSIKEQEKQLELAEQRQKEQEEQKENLQLIAIALFIPIFLIAVLLLSRTRAHRRLIDFMGVLSLLLLFEFITLLIHPQVEKVTHHTPVLELLALVALAAILVPMHHNLTHWLKQKLGSVHHVNTSKGEN